MTIVPLRPQDLRYNNDSRIHEKRALSAEIEYVGYLAQMCYNNLVKPHLERR